MRIIGIDPGSHITGFGIIEQQNNRLHYITSGCINVKNKPITQRLSLIFKQLNEIIELYHPQQAAVEQAFVYINPDSALKLGQARGVALCIIGIHHLPLQEFAPRLVKQAVTGFGGAEKMQVQHMVKKLLNLSSHLQADAADALAIAICAGLQKNQLLFEENTSINSQQALLQQSFLDKKKRR